MALQPSFEQLCQSADTRLFRAVRADPGHVLHDLLPPIKTVVYALRLRKHDRILPVADSLARKTFIIRNTKGYTYLLTFLLRFYKL